MAKYNNTMVMRKITERVFEREDQFGRRHTIHILFTKANNEEGSNFVGATLVRSPKDKPSLIKWLFSLLPYGEWFWDSIIIK